MAHRDVGSNTYFQLLYQEAYIWKLLFDISSIMFHYIKLHLPYPYPNYVNYANTRYFYGPIVMFLWDYWISVMCIPPVSLGQVGE